MKKIIIFIFSLFVVVQANAFSVNLQENQTFFQGAGIKDLTTILVTIDNDNEITKEKSFSLVLPEDSNVRFSSDMNGLTLSGTGVSKLSSGIILMSNLKTIKFIVNDDFKKGDNFNINGLKVIVYTRAQGGKSIGIDTTGDLIADYFSLYTLRVDNTYTYSDQLAPNEVFNFTGKIVDNKVTVSAEMPGDLDFQGVQIDNLDASGKVINGFFRNDMNNFLYDLLNGVSIIKVRTIDTRANYSAGLLFNVSDLKVKEIVVSTGTTNTGVIDVSSGSTNTGTINTSTGVTSTGAVEIEVETPTVVIPEVKEVEKYLPVFKSKSFNDFMIKFDKKLDKKGYKEKVRIVRNDIIKLIEDYEDKKMQKYIFKTKLKYQVKRFIEAYK